MRTARSFLFLSGVLKSVGSDLGYLPVLIDIGYIVIYTPSQMGRSIYIPQSHGKKVVLSKQPGQEGGKVIKRAY